MGEGGLRWFGSECNVSEDHRVAYGVKSVVRARVELADTVTGTLADRLKDAPVVIAPGALAMEDLLLLTLVKSGPPAKCLCVNGKANR